MTERDSFARSVGTHDGFYYPNRAGQFLVVANFLSKFCRHLLPYDDDVEAEHVGNISPRDLEDALAYRSHIHDLHEAEDNRFVLEEYGRNSATLQPVSSRLILRQQAQIDRLKGEIERVADRTKTIHLLLERLEIWSTKYLSQDFLLSSTKLLSEEAKGESDEITDQCCFSPLLNLPAAAYFSSRIPTVSTTEDQRTNGSTNDDLSNLSAFHRPNTYINCCSLAIPPNRYTWKAYARISSLVSLLEQPVNLAKAIRSPCAAYHLLKPNKRLGSAYFARQYTFTAPSLVALWVRAQRNTQALRHLWMLFEVNRVKNDTGTDEETERRNNNKFQSMPGELSPGYGRQVSMAGSETYNGVRGTTRHDDVTSIAITDRSSLTELPLRAILRGNPPYAKYRAVNTSRRVDQLVEWVVVNQSLYTYSRIKGEILSEPQRRARYKRKRMRELYSHSRAKRKRSEGNIDTAFEELHKACQSFIFRWFARRNRKTLSILFSNSSKALELDIGCAADPKVCSKVRELESADVLGVFHKVFAQCSAGVAYPQDRSFALIDRELAVMGKYNESGTITFRSHMLALIDSFVAACPERNLDPTTLATVRHDFITLHDHFLPPGEVDVLKTASSLVTLNSGISADFTDIIKAIPAPWPRTCYICDADDPNLKTCRNCERTFHEKCSPGCAEVNFKDILQSFPPLLDLYKLRKPTNLNRPDFTNEGSMEYKREEIIVERNLEPNGRVEPFGVCLQPLDECRMAFDMLDSDLSSLLDLIGLDEQDSGNRKAQVPVAVENLGCLVTSVQKGLVGARFDLKEGDIITRLELLEFIDGDDRERYGSKVFDMNKISSRERMTVLKVRSSKLKISLLRPSINLVEVGTTWYKCIRKLNMKMLDAFRLLGSLWYCGSCVGEDESELSESNKLFREAQCCRAVIRRLGMESYSLPFIDEERRDVDVNFSLRRLDSMMTHLLHTHSKDTKFRYAPQAFLSSSWTDRGRERVPWATKTLEGRPMELLCNGVKFAMTLSFSGVPDLNSSKISFLIHFLVTFSSWCVAATRKSGDFHSTKGPPPSLKYLQPPWLGASCSVCFSRPVVGDDITCGSEFCRNNMGDTDVEDIGDEEILPAGDAMDEYVGFASFVGTTFLVLPTDPLVKSVSKHVPIDSHARPVEFVVASYLPPSFNVEATRGRPKDATDKFSEYDGIFHLLPVANANQLLFLLERAIVRDVREKNSSGNDWASLDLLNIAGVARYSPTELQKKIEESTAMRIAIEEAITKEIRLMLLPSPSSVDKKNLTTSDDVTKKPPPTASNRNTLNMQTILLDSLLRGEASTELIRSLVSAESDSGIDTDINQTNEVTNDAYRMDNVWYAEEETSGITSLQIGLPIALNPVKTSKKILPLQDDSCCLIYYSDLQFEFEDDKMDLQQSLFPHNLHPRHLPCTDESVLSIVLSSSNNSNIGWGFELVRWQNEGCLRIGRVQKNSTAFKVGLKPHDKIILVNGMKIGMFGSQCEFILSVLGVNHTRVRTSRMLDIKEISQVVSTIKAASVEISAVYLVISRPRFGEGERDQSLDAIPVAQAKVPVHLSALNPIDRATPENLQDPDSSKVQEAAFAEPMLPLQRHEDTGQPRNTSQPNTASRAFPNNSEMISQQDAKLANRICKTLHLRRQFGTSDLNQPALQGTILTRLEVAVFLHAVMDGNQWKLGVRLLMPRYELKTVLGQVKTILSWTEQHFVSIPLISQTTYYLILRIDSERLNCSRVREEGEFVLKELYRGQIYQYRLPRKPLPIDRIIEFDHRTNPETLEQAKGNFQRQPQLRSLRPDIYTGPRQIYKSSNQEDGHWSDVFWREAESPPYDPSYMQQASIDHDGHQEVVDLSDDTEEHRVLNVDDASIPCRSTSVRGPPLVYDVNDLEELRDQINGGDSPTRMRGGGDSEEEDEEEEVGRSEEHRNSDTCLLEVPLEEWNGKAVYCDWTVETNDGKAEACLIGFVRLSADWNSQSSSMPKKVDVVIQYVSTIGYLGTSVVRNLETEYIYAVNVLSGEEKARVVANLLSMSDRHPKTALTESSETQQDSSQKAGPPASDDVLLNVGVEGGSNQNAVLAAVEPARQTNVEDGIEKISVEFSKRLTDLELLGTLPDGSDVFWVSNDPANVFIDESPRHQMLKRSQRQYIRCLRCPAEFGPEVNFLCINDVSKLYCVWGCCVVKSAGDEERHALAFDSSNDLNIHYSKFHTVTARMKEVVLGKSTLLQSLGGQAIVELARGLTAAICARFPLLLEEVQEGDSSIRRMGGVSFFKSPASSILNFPVNLNVMKVACEVMNSSKVSSSIRNLFHLWSRLARLYHCDTTGHLRFTHNEFRPLSVELSTRRSARRRDGHSGTSAGIKTSASSPATTSCTFLHNCRLCSLPFERHLSHSELQHGRSDGRGHGSMAFSSCRRVGCSLLSDAALTKEASSNSHSDRDIPGRLGPAKMLLLKVAHLIPDSIKRKSSFGSILGASCTSDQVDALNSHRIFDGNNFETWEDFVAEAKTRRMLAQAFVTLLASIDRTKLPDWWRRARDGWSTPFMVMSETSLSTLYLHIYVFDAALSELMARSLYSATTTTMAEDDTAKSRSGGDFKRKYEEYWEKAISIGFEPFRGENNSACYYCEEGGTLLCCDLCPNVQHHECVDAVLSQDVTLDHWICDSCLHDIDDFNDDETWQQPPNIR